ncbi:MAG: PAS domain-containing protein [Candidatus Thermoplasmatota archaeon]
MKKTFDFKIISTENNSIDNHTDSIASEYDIIDRVLIGDQRNKTLFDWSPEAIVILNSHGVFLDANQRMYEWLGYKPEEIIGKTLSTAPFFSPEAQAAVMENFKRRIKGIDIPPYEIEFIHKDGSKLWGVIHGSLYKDAATGITFDLVMVSNITEQKYAIEKLRESEEKYRSIFEHASDLIQCVDARGYFFEVNPAWLKALQYSKDEVKRLMFQDILRKDQIAHCNQIFQRVCSGQSVRNVQTIFVTKNGMEIAVEGNINAIMKNNTFIATIGIFRALQRPL